jgi:hypothetical protein
MSINGNSETMMGAFPSTLSTQWMFSFGPGYNFASRFNGKFSEIIFYNSDKSANKAAIESNMNSYYSVYSPMDSDAQAFITAASITNSTQQSAVNTLVTSLKSAGIWSKMKAIYPFVGGTATSHSYNLKNTAQYQITWNGGVTHNSNGIICNGTNGFGDTSIVPSVVSTQDNLGLSFYSRTNNAVDYMTDMGCWNWDGGVPKEVRVFVRTASVNTLLRINTTGFNGDSGTVSDSSGFFTANRTSSNSQKLFRHGSSVINGTATSSTLPDNSVYIGASHSTSTVEYYSNRNYALASYHDGLTDAEASAFYTAVQAFQTTLGRQVA